MNYCSPTLPFETARQCSGILVQLHENVSKTKLCCHNVFFPVIWMGYQEVLMFWKSLFWIGVAVWYEMDVKMWLYLCSTQSTYFYLKKEREKQNKEKRNWCNEQGQVIKVKQQFNIFDKDWCSLKAWELNLLQQYGYSAPFIVQFHQQLCTIEWPVYIIKINLN